MKQLEAPARQLHLARRQDRAWETGHEVEWVGDWPADPGDEEILAHATRNAQVVIVTAERERTRVRPPEAVNDVA